MSRSAPWLTASALTVVMALAACGGGSGGDDGGDGPPTALTHPLDRRGQDCTGCHQHEGTDFAALHRSTSPSYDGDCLKCHGTMLDEKTLSAAVAGPHRSMIEFFVGAGGTPTNAHCTNCHVTTEFDDHSGGDLRRQTYVSQCWGCHRVSGPYSPVLYPN